ncbi:MAG: protease inhibitor I42 family protein [Polyangiaceae bacterium]
MGAATLTVAVGAPFEIELGSPATAGYLWQLLPPPVGVQLIASHRNPAPPKAALGDSGLQVFQLQANQAGCFELVFQLKRPWESAVAEARRVEVEAR